MSQYVYQHTGGKFWHWRHGSPQGIRAAEARELSGMGDSSIIRPGVPEPLTGLGDLGSGVSLLTTLLVLGGGLWIASKVVGRGKSGAGYKKNPAKKRRRKGRRSRRRYRRNPTAHARLGAGQYGLVHMGSDRWKVTGKNTGVHTFKNKASAKRAANALRADGLRVSVSRI